MKLEDIKITKKKMEVLNSMKINNVEQLLNHYPFRYEENVVLPFHEWNKEDRVCFEGTIISMARVTRYGYKKSSTRFKVLYDDNEIDITIFNRPWTSAFQLGKTISIFGKYNGNYKVTCTTYHMNEIKDDLGMLPVYNIKEGITQKDIHKIMKIALQNYECNDFIPVHLMGKYHLLHRFDALKQIHFPTNKESLKNSLRTLKYEEFLKFQLQMQFMKSVTKKKKGIEKCFDEGKIKTFIHNLPFLLTNGQENAVHEILNDLKSDRSMYRLLQGDVGCGKTLVAAICMYACVLSNRQACMMAPTEILAKQHYKNLLKTFKNENLKMEVLYSALTKKKRSEILQRLKNGEIDILVGTHALFQDDVEYANLGVVITDEQHRFGVEQRRKLICKGDKVDFLLMSATPIPRTLAVSLYGDMDVSTIEDMPLGRKEIQTTFINEDSMRTILNDVLMKIDEGEQCYIVCPAIEKNEEYEIRNVEELYKNMNQVLGKKYSLGLLHGKLSSEDKEKVMNDFLDKKYHILIATTVIEVGVDVKDANIMVIYDAHRFGMSQIHQLRGRVGRGDRQGYCFLLSGTKDKDAIERLNICANTRNGFEIASKDLMLRGCGDLLGIRQSGVSSFLLGDIVLDYNILETARKDAIYLLEHIDEFETIQSFIHQIDYTTYLD